MLSDEVRREAIKLYKVSDELEQLAEQHPSVAEILIVLAGNIRYTASLLEVLLATKQGADSDTSPIN